MLPGEQNGNESVPKANVYKVSWLAWCPVLLARNIPILLTPQHINLSPTPKSQVWR